MNSGAQAKRGDISVVMLVVSDGNDVRAKKEADVLAAAGYRVCIIGRQIGADSIMKRCEGGIQFLTVPAVHNARSALRILRLNRSALKLSEQLKLLMLAIIFRLGRFEIGASPAPAPVIQTASEKSSARAIASNTRGAARATTSSAAATDSLDDKLPKATDTQVRPPAAGLGLRVKALRDGASNQDEFSARLIWGGLTLVAAVYKLWLICRHFLKLVTRPLRTKLGRRKWGFKPYSRKLYNRQRYFFYYVETIQTAVDCRPQLVHAHDLFMLRGAVRASQLTGAKCIYDAHEFESERHANISKQDREQIIGEEKKFAPCADGVITVSENIRRCMLENLNIDDVTIVYNAPIYHGEQHRASHGDIRSHLGLADAVPIAIFVGKMVDIFRHDHRVDKMIQAMTLLPHMHLVILGGRTENATAQMNNWAQRFWVADRVHLVDPVPYEGLLSFVRTADIGVNPMENKCLNTDYSMPNKLFEYALAPLPIAQSNLTESMQFINQYNIGLPMDSRSVHSIAATMRAVYEQRDVLRLDEGSLAQLRLDYQWSAQGLKLLQLYSDVLD